MKIKEIYVEAKKSKNFQTYTVGTLVEVSDESPKNDFDELTRQLQAKCRKLAQEQINLDSREVW